ncbi:MAG: hypothetical protein A2Y58_03220 [Chloroflexi bacterium RBG_13_51_52]|nr:MAG: hypothetical protein A2Y58_03220 [Chloroflexi bacterium RBG_13_51_52]
MITYFGGPEGGGKTAMMTRYNRIHHVMGGECWAFPGYELLNERGRVVSKLVYPEEVMGLLNEIQYIVLSIDELQNFMHHHAWADKLVEIITYGAAAQRRKREFVILATGPIFDWVPHDLRQMFHEVVHCSDMHWKNHNIPRGQRIQFTRQDMRGVLSGRAGTMTRPSVFYPGKYFKYYETFSLVDPKYQFHKVRVKKEMVTIDSEGRIISQKQPGISDPATLDRYIQNYETEHQDPLLVAARNVVLKLRANNITKVESDVVYRALGASNRTVAGRALSKIGAIYKTQKKIYDLSEVEV